MSNYNFDIGDLVLVNDIYGIFGDDDLHIVVGKLYTQKQILGKMAVDLRYDDALYELISVKQLRMGFMYKSTSVGRYLMKLY